MAPPSGVVSSGVATWRPIVRERDVVRWTGISSAAWRQLAESFPELPRDPGPRAARARVRLSAFSERALANGAWRAFWTGAAPSFEPTVYVTAHIGSLLALRYVLRSRGITAASVIAPYNFERSGPAAKDAIFDRRFPLPWPHVLSSAGAHRMRTALASGSLILAADLPARASFPGRVLGRDVPLDPRPFRLARLAGVRCRPAFLTLPGRRWTVAIGDPLPEDEARAQEAFACVLESVAKRAPVDLDGLVYWNRIFRAR